MTRKDYALIAKAIANAKLAWPHTRPAFDVGLNAIRTVENNIILALNNAGSNFNAEIFRAACTAPHPKKES